MFNVIINMSREETEATLKASKEAEKIAVDWLAQIRTNILALETALTPVMHQSVMSQTRPDCTYVVSRTAVGMGTGLTAYVCECPAFQYHRGLDFDGYCKHIRTAICNPHLWK